MIHSMEMTSNMIFFYTTIWMLLMKSQKTMFFRIMVSLLPIRAMQLVTFFTMIVWNASLDMCYSTWLLPACLDTEGRPSVVRRHKGTSYNVLRLLYLGSHARCSTWSLRCFLGFSTTPLPMIAIPSSVPYPFSCTAALSRTHMVWNHSSK